MDNKKNIIIIIVIISVITALGYTGYKVLDKKDLSKSNGKGLFTMKTYIGDLYSLNEENEAFKLLEGSIKTRGIKFKENSKEYIILDEKDNLFSIDENGEKREIASNVLDYKISDYKGNAIYYKDKDNNLYRNIEDKEYKEDLTIDSDVDAFKIINNEVIYLKGLKDVYIKSENKESEKVSIEPLLLRNKGLKEDKIFFAEENKVYSYEIKKNDKEEIMDISVDEQNPPMFIEEAYRGILYLTMDFYSEKGIEIYYKNKNKEAIKLAEKISDYKISKNKRGVYYTVQDKENIVFYYKEFSEKEAVNIYECKTQGSILMATGDGIIVNIDEDMIYNIDPSGHKERIGSDPLSSIQKYKDNIVYLNDNNDLYIGKDKVQGDVKNFLVNEDLLAYITEENKVFLIKDNNKPEVVIENAKDYNNIYFNNEELFKNVFQQSDIIGIWQQEDNDKVIFNFEKKKINLIAEHNSAKFNYATEPNYEGYISNIDKDAVLVKIETHSKYVENNFISIDMIDRDNIKINGKVYKKIDIDTFDKFSSKNVNLEDNIKNNMGLEYSKLDIKCSNIMFDEGKIYFLYESNDENMPATILIDEEGIGYHYMDWLQDKKLVKNEEFNKRFNKEEAKLVPYNKDRIIDASKLKHSYIGNVNPSYITWYAAAEIAANDFFKERTDLNEEDVFFQVELMDGAYYVEVTKNKGFIYLYEISPLDGTISRKK